MSIAIRCDKCKTCFDPAAMEEGEEFISISRFITQDALQFANHEYGYLDEGLNLCPNCSKKYMNFWDDPTNEGGDSYAKGFEAGVAFEKQNRNQIDKEMVQSVLEHMGYVLANKLTERKGAASSVPDSQSKAPQRKKRAQKESE